MIKHLIHIGYPKAGSRFVQRWFACHPQFQFVPQGLAGFASATDIARQCAAPPPEIRYRVTSAEELSVPFARAGEIAPPDDRTGVDTAAEAEVCATLAALFPDATVLLLTRGFHSAIISGYSEYLRHGGTRDFYTFDPTPYPPAAPGAELWDYDRIVRLYRDRFGDRLIVLPYELLRDDPSAFLTTLEERLGVDPFEAPTDRVHASLSPAELRWLPRITRLVHRLPVGERLRRRLFAAHVRSIWRNRWRPPIRLLQRLFPAEPVTPALIDPGTVEHFRGRAEALRGDPLYERYREEYLL